MARIEIEYKVLKFFDPEKIKKEVSAALFDFADNEVMPASYEVVPVDTGNLMSTGHTDQPVEDGDTITVSFGYGGPAAGYALYVHEELNPSQGSVDPNWSWAKAAAAGKSIQWTRPGSGPKYLERPFNDRVKSLPGKIADAVRRGFK
jgi:hypothetical protein